MKIERLGKQQFFIFVNSLYLSNVKYNKEEIIDFVKALLFKLKYRLLLQGFYKVKVYLHSKVGVFLELNQLEVAEYNYSLDFRVIVYLDEKVYFKTEDYFVLPSCDVYYADGYYYCNVDFIPNIERIIEFGEFIYGKNLYSVMFRWEKCS